MANSKHEDGFIRFTPKSTCKVPQIPRMHKRMALNILGGDELGERSSKYVAVRIRYSKKVYRLVVYKRKSGKVILDEAYVGKKQRKQLMDKFRKKYGDDVDVKMERVNLEDYVGLQKFTLNAKYTQCANPEHAAVVAIDEFLAEGQQSTTRANPRMMLMGGDAVRPRGAHGV